MNPVNQILVTDKIFITPEFKRKKKVYKWNFICSVLAVFLLFSYCIYAAYEMNKGEETSKVLLADIANAEVTAVAQEDITVMRDEDNVIIVVLDPEQQQDIEEINVDAVLAETVIDTQTYYASDGTPYTTIAQISIPKINLLYPIISETHAGILPELLKKSPCKFWGADPNEVGNFCIVGHNWKNDKFFSNVPKLTEGDIIEITDLKGRTVSYTVYDKYTVDPTDVACTSQLTGGKKEITLITCTNDSKKRIILKCTESSNYI